MSTWKRSLMETGFDSISLAELVEKVNERYGLDLLPTVLFESPNLAAFGEYLVDQPRVRDRGRPSGAGDGVQACLRA